PPRTPPTPTPPRPTRGTPPRPRARHCPSLAGGPPGPIPAASAAATYRRTVLTSTPRLRATSSFGRPAYQCCKISVTSTIVNVLLAISGPPSGSGRKTHSARRTRSGTSPTTPAPRENADRGSRELPDRGGSLTREFRDRQ